jgi:hypothetical protein
VGKVQFRESTTLVAFNSFIVRLVCASKFTNNTDLLTNNKLVLNKFGDKKTLGYLFRASMATKKV